MRKRDLLHRFLFDEYAIRGAIVQLDDVWQQVRQRRDYPEPVRQWLGEALAAAALLSASIKFEGYLSLQLQSEGPLRLLLAQATSNGALRGLARWDSAIDSTDLAQIRPHATLAVTLEPMRGKGRYQGIVTLAGETLAQALELYFNQSEQLPTRIQLACDETTAAGMLLQRLPATTHDPDAWPRIEQLGITLTVPELLSLDEKTILRRLFHQETVRLLTGEPLHFSCTCSREKIAAVLVALGQDSAAEMIAEQGRISVSCEFCGMDYMFDSIDVEILYKDNFGARESTTRH